MAFLAIESISYLKMAVCFLVAFLAVGIIYSSELFFINIINIYSFWASFVVFSDIVFLFLFLVGIGYVFLVLAVFIFFKFLFLSPFKIIIININSLLGVLNKFNLTLVFFK